MVTRYYNCRLIKPYFVEKGELWVENGRFITPQNSCDEEIDLQGLLVAPGYIDIQLNGAYGHDFTQDPNSIPYVAKKITETGVTSFCPTIVSSRRDVYENLPNISSLSNGEFSAHILGYHLEGPFLNASYCGAHDPSVITSAWGDKSLISLYLNIPSISMVTLAPEVDGAYEIINHLNQAGVQVSLGHTEADLKCYQRSVELGAKAVTHLFNAMKPFYHRHPGIIGGVLAEKQIYYSLILDDWHLDPAAVLLAWNTNPEGLFLVSDAMAGMGLDDGDYLLGGKEVTVLAHKAVLSGTDTLAGSVASLDECVRKLHCITTCSISQAIATVTLKPASLLGLYPQKGSLEVGADADFIVLDDDLHVKETFLS